MKEFLNYFVPGIADGSIYALCALGLVLTYKTSGIFNFAQGAIAAASAYLFYQFRESNGMPWPIAALLSILIVGVLGALVLERIAHWMRAAPTVTVVGATVGILVFLQSVIFGSFQKSQIQFPEFLPKSGFTLGNVKVSVGDLIIAGIALGSAVGLYVFFNNSRVGKAMTAVVDDPNLLSLQATNPAAIRRYAWILGSSFAAVSGVLLAPRIGVQVNVLILLVITAFGAAAIGLFDNLPLTFLGALIIGVIVDYGPQFISNFNSIKSSQTWNQLPGNISFIILFGILIFVPKRKLLQRGVRNARRFRPIRTFHPAITSGGFLALMVFLIVLPHMWWFNRAFLASYTTSLGYFIILASLGLITYTSGQISLCHLAFAAIGATTMGHALGHGYPWIVALFSAALVTAVAGALVSIPAIRLSGIFVAVATFGFGVLVQKIVFTSYLMFGIENRVTVPRQQPFGWDLTSDLRYYYLTLVVATICGAIILLVRNSRLGLLLRALSDSPDALDAHGANTVTTRVLVFVIASGLAGVGGAMIAGVTENASGYDGGTWDFLYSLTFVALLGFCGRRPIISPLVAATFFGVLPLYPPFKYGHFLDYRGAGFGFLVILVAVAPGIELPGGRIGGKRSGERKDDTGLLADRAVEVSRKPIQPASRTKAYTRTAVRTGLNGAGSNGHTKAPGARIPAGR